MGRMITLVNYAGGAALAVAFYLGYGDRSWGAALNWTLLYVAAIAIPLWWSSRVSRALARLDPPASAELRRAAYYPVMAGVMTMLVALGLIYRAHAS